MFNQIVSEVHARVYFSVITSGVICVLKLCYALRQTHILMTCTCNCSMHISPYATAPCTCNCSMQIQHLHVLAQARPTMSCILLVVKNMLELVGSVNRLVMCMISVLARNLHPNVHNE